MEWREVASQPAEGVLKGFPEEMSFERRFEDRLILSGKDTFDKRTESAKVEKSESMGRLGACK